MESQTQRLFGPRPLFRAQQSVTRDHGPKAGLPYDSLPQWLDGNLNGVVDGTPTPGGVIDDPKAPGEHQYPLSYVRSTPNTPDTMSVIATFAAPLQAGEQIEGVTNYQGIVFGPVTVNGARTSVSLTASKPLPSTIDDATLQITWEYSLNGGNFQTIEQTTNHLYVTGAPAPHVYETELYIACSAGRGKTPRDPGQAEPGASAADNTVLQAVFAKFQTLTITRADGTPLTYYHDYTDMVHEVEHLLKTADGECGSWTELLMGALTAAGVKPTTLQHVQFNMDKPTLGLRPSVVAGFFVKSWTFTGSGTSGDNTFSYKNVLLSNNSWAIPVDLQKNNRYVWDNTDTVEVTQAPGTPGQNNQLPASIFFNHQMVTIINKAGTTYYDPSFGVTYTSQEAFASRALVGYFKGVLANDGSGKRWYEIEKNQGIPATPDALSEVPVAYSAK